MSERASSDNELLQHHAARLTMKVIEDDAGRTLKTWIDGLDAKAQDDLLDRIYGAVGDEIEETLEQPDYEADMDDQIPVFGAPEDDGR